MTYLFIGGLAGGQRIAIPDATSAYRVPYDMASYQSGIDLYLAQRLAGSNGDRFTVYVHEKLTGSDLIRRLLDGYRIEQQKAMSA